MAVQGHSLPDEEWLEWYAGHMRIERTGTVAPLTPRVVEFLKEELSGVSLDDPLAVSDMRPDYICLGGRLVIELKTLAEDGSERMDNLTDELRQREARKARTDMREWVVKRRERTRYLIELGGLVVKAGLVDLWR